MESVWYALLAFMFTVYVVLDGFDFGAGIIHHAVAKTDEERRTVMAAIGPLWDGNEVWLIAGGGVLVFAFPRAYAAAFSGFYLPLMMVLWLLIGRGISIEFRSHDPNPLWRAFWDAVFTFASAVIAIVLGASLGNVIRGVPLDAGGYFRTPLFTDFETGNSPGALDWYTVLVGLFSLAALAAHGALYLNWKTEGPMQSRARRISLRLYLSVALLLIPVTLATRAVRPAMFARLWDRPAILLFGLGALAALAFLFLALRRGRDRAAFIGSAAFLASLLAATAAALFPVILPSTISPGFSLTAQNAANSHHGLAIGLLWWVPALLLAIAYSAYLFHAFRGKVHAGESDHP